MTRNIAQAIDPGAVGHTAGLGGFRFAYSAYGYFVGFLIAHFGEDQFRRYVSMFVADPKRYAEDFSQVYGVSFTDAVSSFARRATQ